MGRGRAVHDGTAQSGHPGGSVDVAFAHALFEYLGRPADALADADATEWAELKRAGEAAGRWAEQEGEFVMRWVEVTARGRLTDACLHRLQQ